MRLTYRGNGYEYEPVETNLAETDVFGKYRGQGFHFSYPRHIPVPQPPRSLSYRGVHYETTESGAIHTVSRSEATSLKMNARQAVMQEVEQIHQQNIQRRLQHRLEVAQQRGDEMLVRQLQQEMGDQAFSA
ncbi:arginine synthesis PII-interacting regulator PirA [Leptolyngbya sp. AN02str]|uniref:arginine synthesis PII-interacting regulator PirA n=1 Tax=Leptolyngbya sp. AN02str TaxID=3423363 RepID=UPI003D32016B